MLCVLLPSENGSSDVPASVIVGWLLVLGSFSDLEAIGLGVLVSPPGRVWERGVWICTATPAGLAQRVTIEKPQRIRVSQIDSEKAVGRHVYRHWWTWGAFATPNLSPATTLELAPGPDSCIEYHFPLPFRFPSVWSGSELSRSSDPNEKGRGNILRSRAAIVANCRSFPIV